MTSVKYQKRRQWLVVCFDIHNEALTRLQLSTAISAQYATCMVDPGPYPCGILTFTTLPFGAFIVISAPGWAFCGNRTVIVGR
eukprot:4566946-Amphidinium_carterae.1